MDRELTLDLFDPASYGGAYKLWQWFSPVKISG
jgi:hypothetical protein